MNIFERALAYIRRKNTRAIIILLILTIITASIYACLAVQNASKKMASRVLATANVSFQIRRIAEDGEITTSAIEQICKDFKIKKVNYRTTVDAKLSTGEVVSGEQKIQIDGMDEKFKNLVKVYAVNNSKLENTFTSESFKLISGKPISSDENRISDAKKLDTETKNQILVHEKLAEKNHWALGDKITLNSLSDEKKEQLFEISGIFSGQVQESFNGLSSDLSENMVYVNFGSGQALAENIDKLMVKYAGVFSDKNTIEQATFFLEQPEKMEETIAEIKKMSLDWQKLELTKNAKDFEGISSSIKTMQSLLNIMTLGIILAGTIALSLILILWLRERVYEIGVLLAIGRTKLQIVGQFILELLLLILPATVIAMFIGSVLSKQLLAGLIVNEEISQVGTALNSSMSNIINLPILGLSFLIMTIVIMSAVFFTSISILTQKPKKILAKIS